jgi:uncharacterized protein YgbK (DUF1537 family)
MLLGCIADDFTGATDLANTLTRRGMKTALMTGLSDAPAPQADAVVVALKSRTIPAEEAVAQSLAACRWLKAHGARQIYFKYCSTFDSTDKGNIGPVADALLDELKADFTIACPAFPENGRTIYMGHLFVGDVLLSQSSMRHHPLTPMHDSNLVAVLARQSRYRTGLVNFSVVRQGPQAITDCFTQLKAQGVRHAIVDAIVDDNLLTLAEACADLVLITGGSGAALGLPENFRRQGLLAPAAQQAALAAAGGPAVVLSGSCSQATLAQVKRMAAAAPTFTLDVAALHQDFHSHVAAALTWWAAQRQAPAVLMAATASPEQVAEIQDRFGREESGALVERAFAALARQLAAAGVRRFVVAGGETSGAVVSALGITALEIGAQIAPGVPATLSYGTPRYALALKSGNFGGPDFFAEALEQVR